MAFELASANFRALKILKDANGAALAGSSAAQPFDVAGVILMGAVREVEAGDIHAEVEKIAQERFGITGGTDGADDLRTAGSVGYGLCQS
jgi:hypothetical protein